MTGVPVRTVLDGSYAVEHRNDVFGREVLRRLPRGGALETAFDYAGWVTRRRTLRAGAQVHVGAGEPEWLGENDGAITAERAYRFDRDHWLLHAWDWRAGATQYQYDAANRLLGFLPEKGRGESFRYDAAGNVSEAAPGAPAREYARGNQLVRRDDTAYAWDAAGRLVEQRARDLAGADRVTRYSWDGAGRLAAVDAPDGTRVEFVYDAFSRRMQKRVLRPRQSGAQRMLVSSTLFVWDGDTLAHEIHERAGADPVVEERTYCITDHDLVPKAQRDAGTWYEYVTDPVGTPERLVDAAGEVVCELERTAWGRLRSAAGAVTTTPLRLPGQYEDEETGLVYNRFRYYDPDSGQFISSDPLGLAGGLNGYTYAPNAITWTDPLGLVNLTPAAQTRLASLPSTPGVYQIESGGKTYIGSALDLKDRLCGSKPHPKAEKMLNDPNAKITVTTVDPGSGKITRTQQRGVKVIEQDKIDATGQKPICYDPNTTLANDIPALNPKKKKKYGKAYGPTETGTTSY